MKKIIVCPDSFKGSMDAFTVSETIKKALKECSQDLIIETVPLADGGEGTIKVLSYSLPLDKINITASDPLLNPLSTFYYADLKNKTAYMESALTIGLNLVPPEKRNPLTASSFGLGEIIFDACRRGFKDIYISIGGTATCDGGTGMLKAMGYEFINEKGEIIEKPWENLIQIKKIRATPWCSLFEEIRFHVIGDVTNPLLGKEGAVYVYAPQKGGQPEDLHLLEKGMANFADIAIKDGFAHPENLLKKGAGAAGGLGFSLCSFLKADYKNGIDFIINLTKFEKTIKGADLIITGEGKIDKQSLMGKVVSGVVNMARKNGIPVIALAGKVEEKEKLLEAGLKGVYEISQPQLSLEENMEPETTTGNLKSTIHKIFYNNELTN